MIYVSSSENPAIKQLGRLSERKYRYAEKLYIAEGRHLINEAIACGKPIEKVFIRDSVRDERPKEAEELIERFDKKLYVLSDGLFDKFSDTVNSQGVLAVIGMDAYDGKEELPEGRILILDRIQDPGNLGTIIRTADAAGFTGALLIKGTADPYSPKAIRAASGAVFRLPLLWANAPGEAAGLVRKCGKQLICSTPHGGSSCFDAKFDNNLALVIGNEGAGACDELIEAADLRVLIPMKEGAESLNAAVAAGILMFEIRR